MSLATDQRRSRMQAATTAAIATCQQGSNDLRHCMRVDNGYTEGMGIGLKDHWETIYASKTDAELSWHQQKPGASHQLITEFATFGGSVIDIGGGSSSLAAQLVMDGFMPVTVLDISKAALERAQNRIAPSLRSQIDWRVGDILASPELPSCDVWQDRAVFHFLVQPDDQARYAALARETVKQHGFLIVGTFASDGPERCSGLPVHRYDSNSLPDVFGEDFELKRTVIEEHITPSGVRQPFVYVVMERR
jgi:SAM-dependent methyltransferase